MFRTQVYLTEIEKEGLKALGAQKGESQSGLIRKAIDQYLEQQQQGDWKENLLSLAGIWKDRTDLPDFALMRAESDDRL